jgi:hypothetical protein
MADRVIIVGASRHNEMIPIGDLRQMAGRSGRGHERGQCHADFIVEESDADYVALGLDNKSNLIVTSVIGDDEKIAFHVLPEICSQNVTDEETARQWHSRSFHAFSGGKIKWPKVFENLRLSEAIEWDGQNVSPTDLGRIASSFYFPSSDVKAWKDNFAEVFDLGLENEDVAVAWALGSVEENRKSGDFGKHWETFEVCKNRLPPELSMKKGCAISTTLWWHVFGGPPVGKLKNQAIELKDDFGRIHKVLLALNDKQKWNKADFFDSLMERSRKAIPSEMVDIMRVSGMTKGKAVALREMGIEDRESLNRAKENMDLTEVFGEAFDFSP